MAFQHNHIKQQINPRSHTHCALSHTTHSLITDGSSSSTQQGSIIGFAVVLSFLVISIFVVMLICSCYGLCKCPCKRSIAREPHTPISGSSRRRRERPMIPLPSPRTGTIKQSTSSTFQYGQKLPTTSLADQPIYSKLQFGRNYPPAPAAAVVAPTTGSFREDERRLNQLSPTRFSVPPPTNAPNVMHLSQLQSHSYHSDLEQMALGSINPPSIGRQGGRTYQPQPQQQRHELSSNNHQPGASNSRQTPTAPWNTTNGNSAGPPTHNHHQNTLPPHFQAKPVDVPPPYPGMGYPYTPCKSPKTPHSTSATSSTTTTQPSSLSHSQLHNRRTAMRQQEQASANGAEGQGAGGMEGESEILTDIDSVTEINSVVSGRERFKELATSPPSYSTEV